MLKNWKAGIGYGILLWLLIFVEVVVVMLAKMSESGKNFVNLVLLVPLVVFCTWMYFKSVKPNGQEGLYLGIVFLIVGTILDLAVTIPFFVKDFGAFYSSGWLWVSYVELLAVTTVTGAYLRSKAGEKKRK
ncbi:hypothetical protein HYT52_01385 [Candidatus Woesearchaeota archaeon]|nr:hypothetical protein [Candidatus Woesearchaeota archaeon]